MSSQTAHDAATVIQLLSGMGVLRQRKMFGGVYIYCDDLFIATVHDDTLYFKANASTAADFIARGLPAFSYPKEGGTATLQYYQAPPEVFTDPAAMNLWAGRALLAARQDAASKSRQTERPVQNKEAGASMQRYVAFLRGVSPMNCKMPELKRCFESAGFADVKTLLSSGNVAFSTSPAIVPTLERAAEEAMEKQLGKVFQTIVRPSSFLRLLLEMAPFGEFDLPANAKPVITFLRKPCDRQLELPIQQEQAAILKLEHTEVFSAYVPNERGPVFMSLLEKTFGKEITTRTLETVRKCSIA